MKKQNKKRAVIYVQVMAAQRVEKSIPNAVGESGCRAYADVNGFEAVMIFRDIIDDEMAFEKVGFQLLLDHVSDDDIHAIIVDSSAELPQSLAKYGHSYDGLELRGIEIHVVSDLPNSESTEDGGETL